MPPNEQCPNCHRLVADWHVEWYKTEGPSLFQGLAALDRFKSEWIQPPCAGVRGRVIGVRPRLDQPGQVSDEPADQSANQDPRDEHTNQDDRQPDRPAHDPDHDRLAQVDQALDRAFPGTEICVPKPATTGAGGANFSRSRTFSVSVASDDRFSSTRILPSSCSISPRTRLSSTSILSTSSSLPDRSFKILCSVCSSTFLFLIRASMS